MKLFDQDTQVFIVRVWYEPRTITSDPSVWRGVAEHLTSGKRHYFVNLNELPAIFALYIEPTQPFEAAGDPALPERPPPTTSEPNGDG